MSNVDLNQADNFRVLSILALLITSGMAIFYLAPLLEEIFMAKLQVNSTDGELIVSAEVFGITLASVPAAVWINKISWRKTLYVTSAVIILVNLACVLPDSFAAFLAFRFICGFAAGVQLAICMAVIHRTHDLPRNLGYWAALQLLVAVVILLFVPALVEIFTAAVIFVLLALISLVMLAFVRCIPEGRELREAPVIKTRGSVYCLGALGLAALFLASFGLFSVWSFYTLIAETRGISLHIIHESLSSTNLFGIFGTLAAMYFSTRFGLVLPLVTGFGLVILSYAMLLGDFALVGFITSGCLFGFAQYFVKPYIVASIANVDANGRLMILTGFVAGLGTSLGPDAGAFLHDYWGSYTPILLLGMVAMLCALLFILRLALQPSRDWH